MGILDRLRGTSATELTETRRELAETTASLEYLQESLAELELALDDEGWLRIALQGEREFTRAGLAKIISLARLMWLKNPLVQRAVNVRGYYVWGQGVTIRAKDDQVNTVVQRMLADRGNRAELFGARARLVKEQTLATDGNLFLVLLANPITGHLKIRSVPVDEIVDIHTNPDDRRDPWFYERRWTETRLNQHGTRELVTEHVAYYPDWQYQPRQRPATLGGRRIVWDQPIYHVKVGGLDGMRFGVPETYAVLDWARAYKGFLEDWASLAKSLSRFAWRLTTNPKKLTAAKEKLSTRLSTTQVPDTNPAPTAGSAFIGDSGATLDAIPKTGAQTSAEDGKGLRLMVAAGMDLPDTILSGDPDQGNLATASTLDRPTELAMVTRQQLWAEVIADIATFAVTRSIDATQGRLTGTVTVDADGLEEIHLDGDLDPTVEVTFPPVLEQDAAKQIGAIVTAATLDGKTNAGTIPERELARMLLVTLGEDHVDELLDQLDTERETAAEEGVTESFIAALRELREAVGAAR